MRAYVINIMTVLIIFPVILQTETWGNGTQSTVSRCLWHCSTDRQKLADEISKLWHMANFVVSNFVQHCFH